MQRASGREASWFSVTAARDSMHRGAAFPEECGRIRVNLEKSECSTVHPNPSRPACGRSQLWRSASVALCHGSFWTFQGGNVCVMGVYCYAWVWLFTVHTRHHAVWAQTVKILNMQQIDIPFPCLVLYVNVISSHYILCFQ